MDRELSIFIDESGDIGSNSSFYLLAFVLHDQSVDISDEIGNLARHLRDLGYTSERALHTGPMVRREDEYRNLELSTRKRLFTRLFAFARRCGIEYKTFCIEKKQYPDPLKLKARLAREVSLFLRDNAEFFTSFDHVIVYYDNGQAIVTNVINTVFAANFFEADIRRVVPSDYRLFQVADLICTLELIAEKIDRSIPLTRSEEVFFGSCRSLKKDYLKQLRALRFD